MTDLEIQQTTSMAFLVIRGLLDCEGVPDEELKTVAEVLLPRLGRLALEHTPE